MNFLKKGPELKMPDKMPEIKAPGFIADIYYELRERHLLPLVVVLIAGIVAVPLALSETTEPVETPAMLTEAGVSTAGKTQVVVARSEPGLRDYRKRLSHLKAKDPFKERLDGLRTTASEEAESTTGNVAGTEVTEEPRAEPTAEPTAPPEETDTNDGRITFYSYAMDVRVTPVSVGGVPSNSKPEVREDLPELTQLPSRQTPAIVFMGVTKDGNKALMLVSSNVKGLFGDNVCAVGGEACELLAMEPGVPETIVYGGNEKIYRIELTDLILKRTDKLNKAPLGKPKKKGKGQGGGAG